MRDPINTPSLSGWVIAAGLGALWTVISYLQFGVEGNGSVLIGGLVTVVVGVILGLPSSATPAGQVTVAAHSSPAAIADPAPVAVVAPAAAADVAPAQAAAPAPVAAAAPVVAPPPAATYAPVADPTPAAPPAQPGVDPAPRSDVLQAAVPVMDPVPAAAPPQDKPRTLTVARDGRPDDLKLIRGIGPKMEAMLNRMGFFHFDQVAAWTPAELAWVDDNLEGFKGRASRDEWVAQARILAAGGSTEFASRPH